MSHGEKLDFNSRCVHSGIEENEFGSVVPPIYQTSTFKFKSVEHGASLFAGEEKGYIYTRMANPTVEAMENAIADLEGGHKALRMCKRNGSNPYNICKFTISRRSCSMFCCCVWSYHYFIKHRYEKVRC